MSHAPVETIDGSSQHDTSLANVKLLPELLSIIIETYVFDFLHSFCVPGQSPALHPQNSWFRISHVCRYWRDVTLATPTIWSHIPLIRLDCVEEMLRRSKQAPLTLYVHWTTPLNESSSMMSKSIAKECHRIRNIDTSLPSELFTQLTSYAQTSPLELQSVVASYKRLLEPPSSLPLEWIKNANLKHLSLKDFPTENINLLLKPSLTSLSLWLSKHECVPGDDLLEALQHMHSLRSLTLHNVVQDILTLPSYPDKRDPIRMPRLQSIATTSYTNGLAELSLLSAIDIPPHVDFSFVIHNAVYPETQEIIWSYILDNIVKDVRSPFHSVFIYAYAGGNFLFTARSPAPPGSTRDSTLFQISLHFPVVSEAEKWLSRLCTSLPCSKVRNLSVGNFISFPVEAWYTSFKSMTHVESLEVTGLACTALPEVLLLAAAEDSQIPESKPIFPYLRQLTVWLNPTAKGETVSSRVNGICDALQERKGRGYQLELLILRGHPPLVEEFDRLIPVVGKVVWDR